jgi:hypothetical protein
MARLTVSLAAVAVLVISGVSYGFTYLESGTYGYMVPAYDARSLAMGGAGLASAEGARGLSLNPALLGRTEGIEVAVTGLVAVAEEAREVPLYDSFDGIIAYNTYAMNTGVYDRYSGAVAVEVLTVEAGNGVLHTGVGLGYGPRIEIGYNAHVQFRGSDDLVIYDYYAEGDGGINAFTVGVGQEVVSNMYVGLGIDFLRGDYDRSTRYVFSEYYDYEDEASRFEYDDVSGTRFSLGLLYDRLHRLSLAAVYRTGFELSGTKSARPLGTQEFAVSDFTHKYPGTLALGVQYRPRNLLMTTVSADIEYTGWSSFEDDTMADDPDLDDTVTYRIGVEHAFFDDTMARFGFSYNPSYTDKRSSTAAFSLGLGLDVLGAKVDVGGQVGLREYDYGEERRIRETTTLAMATITHTF